MTDVKVSRDQEQLAKNLSMIQNSGKLVKVEYTENEYNLKKPYGSAHFKDETGKWFILEVNRYVDHSKRGTVNSLLLNTALMKFFQDNGFNRKWNYPLTVQNVDQLLDDAVNFSKWIEDGNAPEDFEGWCDTDDEKQNWIQYSVVRRRDTSGEEYILMPLGIVSTDDLMDEIRKRIHE